MAKAFRDRSNLVISHDDGRLQKSDSRDDPSPPADAGLVSTGEKALPAAGTIATRPKPSSNTPACGLTFQSCQNKPSTPQLSHRAAERAARVLHSPKALFSWQLLRNGAVCVKSVIDPSISVLNSRVKRSASRVVDIRMPIRWSDS